ncbi:MAG: SDR family oxidoreductase [Bacteroidales bacterium]|nr:SDR family oxidoreductase [Bacteroidales bacterium]
MIKNENGLKDPRDKRGLPESYEKQMQEAPGIQAEMKPVPDSGEETYEGCGRLKGRKAFITGGDSGIGRAVAIAYAREGAEVAINYLSDENKDADSLVELLSKEGIDIHCLPGDISTEEGAKKTIRQAKEKLGQIDILVLNAGTQRASNDLDEITSEQLLNTFSLNVFSPFWMVQEIHKDMPKGSCILFTSSSEFFKPAAKLTEYASSKYAVVGLSRSLAKQLVEKGIRVNTVCPGSTWTPLEISGGLKKDDIPDHGSVNLMQRAAQPYEIAGVYVFLASEEASFVTCATYGVDGGMETV